MYAGSYMQPRVEAIIPTLNEQYTIGEVLRGTWKHVDRILVIDGYSTDDTASVAEKYGAVVVYQNGSGKGQAVREALAGE